MSGTNFNVTNQHDLLLAAATVLTSGPGVYTLNLTNNVVLAEFITLTAPAGTTLRIDGNGFSLLGGFAFDIHGQGGTVVLNATDTSTYSVGSIGTTLFTGTGTLEIARADAAGLGVVTLNSTASYPGPLTVLKLDSGAIIGNPVHTGFDSNPHLNVAIDLVGVIAAIPYVTVDLGYGLVIPVLGGGSVLVETGSNPGTTFLLTPDGAGGTMMRETNQPVASGVTVRGVGGTTLDIPFDNPVAAPPAQLLANPLNVAVAGGGAIPFVATPGGALPAVAAGQTLEVIAHAAGAYTLPVGIGLTASAAFITDSTGVVSLTGGDADGQFVLAGTGGLSFVGGKGQGSVIAGGGDNTVFVGVGQGQGDQFIQTGDGNDTITAYGGHDWIEPGGGSNLVMLGLRNDSLTSIGNDTIIGAPGQATITANLAGGHSLLFLGSGGTNYTGGGANTIVGNTGNDTIATNAASASLLFLGSGQDSVQLGGADTVLTGVGAPSVSGSGRALIYGGAAPLYFLPGSGVDTIVADPGSVTTIAGGGGVLAFAYGPVDYEGAFAAGAATIIGTTAAITVHAGYYGGAFIGGSAGHNDMTGGTYYYNGGSVALLIGGGDADTLRGGNSGATVLQPAAGASTLVGGSALDVLAFVHSTVANALVQGFDPSLDFITLYGFPVGEAFAALAGSTTAGGSQSLTLSDGTHLTFQGLTGLTLSSFH